MSEEEFESASVIYGDLNDYIERVWGEERYTEAIHAFDNAIVMHDVTIGAGAVHTEYNVLKNTTLKKEMTILTHGPDRITSEWTLSNTEKHFRIKGRKFFEIVDDKLFPMDADIYHKEAGRYYAGYKNESGLYGVYEKNGILRIAREGEKHDFGKLCFKIDMYEDISGKYLPKLENDNTIYFRRKDGRIELIEFTKDGSKGKIAEDLRPKLQKH